MRRAVLILLVFVCVLPGCRRGRVISNEDFAAVYEDMLLADQWLEQNPEARRTADTTLFYEPIFKEHGITKADFDATLSALISEPDKFTKTLDKVRKSLERKRRIYLHEIGEEEYLRAEADSLERLTLVPVRLDTITVRYIETVGATRLDTAKVSGIKPKNPKKIVQSKGVERKLLDYGIKR